MTTESQSTGASADQAAALRRAGLRVERFRFVCRARGELRLPPYAGSALRGMFGRALKSTVCVVDPPECTSCLIYRTCVYPYVFETPPPPAAQRMRKYPAVPHPFVVAPRFAPREVIGAGVPFDFDVALVGRAIRHVPYVVHAFRTAGVSGGGGRGQFVVERVMQCVDHVEDRWETVWTGGVFPKPQRTCIPPAPPVAAQGVTLSLTTPLRLVRDGRPIGPDELVFADLFRHLLRRISLLAYFHGETPLETDFARLAQTSRGVQIEHRDLRWFDWSRYSSRQRTRVPMGGVIGHLTLDGDALAPYWPYIWFGQWTHAGKGASMGLGRYQAAPTSKPATAAAA